jgi:hypothetical protein
VGPWWDGSAWGSQTRPIGVPQPKVPPPPSSVLGHHSIPAAYTPVPHQEVRRRSGCFGIATGVMFGILGAFVLLVGGCVALIASSANDDALVSVTTSPPLSATVPSQAPAVQGEVSTSTAGAPVAGGSEADDALSCDRLDKNTIVLEVVNNSPKTSSYLLTVGFFDDAGQRLGDETTVLNHLRPAERAIEETYVFEQQGTVCKVIGVERTAAESLQGELAEVSACDIGSGADVLGLFKATLSATNSSPQISDYLIDVAFVGPDGVRRGDGTATVQAVRPSEAAPTPIFTTVRYQRGFRCDVVAVTRNASS